MNQKSLAKLALAGVLIASSAHATEMRTPWIAQRGPLRYTFDKLYPENKRNINMWTAAHTKEAHKAFLKHGTNTSPLTALIFNKADFQLNEIFPDSDVPFGSENFSPFLKLIKIHPRVSYTEYGITVGGRIDWPVWCNKGRIGLRATVPFRRIEWERDDNDQNLNQNANPLNDFIASQMITIDRNSPRADIDAAAAAASLAAGNAGNGNAGGDAALAAINVSEIGGTATQAVANAMVLNGAIIANAINGVVPVGSTFAGSDSASLIAATAPAAGNFGNNTAAAINATDATAGQVVAAALATRANGGALGTAAGVQNVINNGDNTAAINLVANRGNRAALGNQIDVLVNAYRLDFVASLENANHESAVQIPAVDEFKIFGSDIQVPATQRNRVTVGVARAADSNTLVNSGFVAWMPAPDNEPTIAHVTPVDNIVALNATLTPPPPTITQVGYFSEATDYRPQLTVGGAGGELKPEVLADGGQAQQLWLTFRRAADSNDPEKFAQNPTGGVGAGATIARNIENLIRQYRQSPVAFFQDQGFSFDDQLRAGLGDIDVDLFYEHMFSCDFMGELCLGVRLPTGAGDNYCNSPWKANLGNGEHWEIKIGGLLAWQPHCLFNIKVDASYNFVLESTEKHSAAFKGALIKNFGPCTEADVDWGYFIGHVDFTFFHPKTQDIRSMIGYEILYKTEDHLTFKQTAIQSFLGGQFNPVTGLFEPNPKPLDSGLARKGTQSIAHKVRTETSFQINPYFEIYAGASGTFAGKDVMRDRDLHGGFNIRF